MKKQQPSKVEDVITSIVAFVLSFIITTAIWIVRFVVWPLVRASARFLWSRVVTLLTRAKVVKAPKAAKQLPTPEIFKGAPNLAPARQVRF